MIATAYRVLVLTEGRTSATLSKRISGPLPVVSVYFYFENNNFLIGIFPIAKTIFSFVSLMVDTGKDVEV